MSCAAPEGGHALPASVSGGSESVIQGLVQRSGQPVRSYVRLLDATGEFTAEVPTGDDGRFRFFAAPGEWTLRTLAPRSDAHDTPVSAARGAIAEVVVDLPEA
jgi:hypothetical protein